MDPVSTSIVAKLAGTAAAKVGKPLLGAIGRELRDLSADLQHAFFGAFTEYVNQVYERHSFFQSVVFPNQQRKLKDFYLPLTLQWQLGGDATQLTLDDYPGAFISEKKDILVVDTAGMGKSTLLKFIFLRAVELGVGIPIFIELRKLSATKTILDFVHQQLTDFGSTLDKDHVLRLLRAGEFVFFLDGYDEIALGDREAVTSELIEFKRRANKNRFIVTSRDVRPLGAFSDFFRVTIKPLLFDEAALLIAKLSEESELGAALIVKLQEPRNQPIHEFLQNPLLVSLLFKAFEFKQAIPLKKHVFYRQVYEALFENHDLSKELGGFARPKASGLDIYSFDLVMRALAYVSLSTTKIEYEKDELLRLIERCQEYVPTITFNPHQLVSDLTQAVPLFVEEGPTLRWAHKSLQEYFAAQYVASGGRKRHEEVLLSMYRSENGTAYQNFLSLFADIEPTGFRHTLGRAVLLEVIREFDQPLGAPAGVQSAQIMYRRQVTCFRRFILCKLTQDEINSWQPGQAGLSDAHTRFMATTQDLYVKTFGALPTSSGFRWDTDTVVVYSSPRWQVLRQLIGQGVLENLGLRVEMQPLHSPSPLKEPSIVALTTDENDPLNHLEIFDVTSKFLSDYTEQFIADPNDLVSRVSQIDEEIARMEAQPVRF